MDDSGVVECSQGALLCGIFGGCISSTSCSWMICGRGEMDDGGVGEYSLEYTSWSLHVGWVKGTSSA